MPIASVTIITSGAATSVHTPHPLSAPVSAVTAPVSAAARRTCAGRRKSIRRLRIACGSAQNGTARYSSASTRSRSATSGWPNHSATSGAARNCVSASPPLSRISIPSVWRRRSSLTSASRISALARPQPFMVLSSISITCAIANNP